MAAFTGSNIATDPKRYRGAIGWNSATHVQDDGVAVPGDWVELGGREVTGMLLLWRRQTVTNITVELQVEVIEGDKDRIAAEIPFVVQPDAVTVNYQPVATLAANVVTAFIPFIVTIGAIQVRVPITANAIRPVVTVVGASEDADILIAFPVGQ